MALSLSDPYLKTTRAKEHLDSLRNELDVYYKSNPYSLVGEDDVERERYCIYIKFIDPSDRIWLIAGDLFYCMRASLDQLVWALAKLNLPYPEHTQFPIFDSLDASKFERYTRGVPAEASSIIESLQPYKGGSPTAIRKHLLRQLNLICNIDKHRRIPLHGQEGIFPFPDVPKSARGLLEIDPEKSMMSLPARFKAQMRLDPRVEIKVTMTPPKSGADGMTRAPPKRAHKCARHR